MKTEIVNFASTKLSDVIELIEKSFKANLPIGLPTETVYGLAAPFNNEEAIRNIFKIKNRPSDNPLIVHVASFEQIDSLISDENYLALRPFLEKFWPGPLTVLFNKSSLVSDLVTAGSDKVAIRMPGLDSCRKIISVLGVPLVAPSANISTRPSPTNALDVFEDLNEKIELIIDDGPTEYGLESTIIDFDQNLTPTILRPGKITPEDLINFFGDVNIPEHLLDKNLKIESLQIVPGMKYLHYSPNAKVILFKNFSKIESALSNPKAFLISISEKSTNIDSAINYLNYDEFEKNIFKDLRAIDRKNFEVIYIEYPKDSLALQNRLTKAASEVID